jgi:hypothetical protein
MFGLRCCRERVTVRRMVWGKRSGYALVFVLLAATASGSGCGSKGGAKDDMLCGPTEVAVCNDRGIGRDCVCTSAGVAGTGGLVRDAGGRGGSGGTEGGFAAGGVPPVGGSSGGGVGGIGGVGGVGGVSGTRGLGGIAGTGAAGSGGVPGSSRLGAACVTSGDCGAGLICLPASSSELGGGGPPRGLCTASCAANAASCAAFDPNAVCLNFGTDVDPVSYCIQGCAFGPDPNKCRGRAEVACSPLYGALGTACATDVNCGSGNVCADGQCLAVIPGCLPLCNSDADCGTGRYCNPADGLCYGTPKAGSPTGQACTEPAAGAPDPCRGTCIGLIADSGDPVGTHVCADACTLGALPACGWAGPTSNTAAEAMCIFSAIEGAGTGDRGTCAQTCNCNGDCRNPALVCAPLGNAQLEQSLRKRGFCTLAAVSAGIPCP